MVKASLVGSFVFVKAKETGKRRVTYWDKNGSSVEYIGGNRTWRNQNPGNIGAGSWADRQGAIGKAGGFAVFPNYELGRNAIFSRLRSPDFIDQSIWDVIKHYAPAEENDVSWYRKLVKKITGLDLKRKIRDLSKDELEKLVNAIERAEGRFKSGKIVKNIEKKHITAVQKDDKGIIISYFVKGIGWLSKAQAIQMTKAGKIDAVVACSRAGHTYLRARPDHSIENNLGNLG